MQNIKIIDREMTPEEYATELAGFNQHAIEHGNPVEEAERFTFVLLDGDTFIGCSSGLAYKSELGYSNWFYLSDMFIEKAYRGQHWGTRVLTKLEKKVAMLGIKTIWTWTGAHEGYPFYLARGYTPFCEQENWYNSGHSRFGLKKELS